MALLYLILGIIIARFFWRQLVIIASWAALLLVLVTLWRTAPALGLSSGWMLSAYGAGVAGFVVGALVALKPVINFLVESDFRRNVERERATADRRRV